MKLLQIDYDYYLYPQGMTCVEDFIAYANQNYHSFIELTQFSMENCVFPYLIKEDAEKTYVNIAEIDQIKEVEATLLDRADYDERLRCVVAKKCVDCEYYIEGDSDDDLEEHRDRLSLDGDCAMYSKKEN